MLNTLVKNKLTWQLLRPIAKIGRTLSQRRDKLLNTYVHPLRFAYLFPEKTILHGPFKGMKYPSFDTVCSMIYPKLIGSYEKEIQPIIQNALKADYSEVVDIGCAEGYYAVGFAMQTKAKVYAYDTEESARLLCRQMAILNGVDHQVEVKSFCSPEELRDFPFTGKALIICDCEGYEFDLFTEENLTNLRGCDLLIETHDLFNIEISLQIQRLFSNTHDISIIKSIDDIEKAKTYSYPETDSLDLKSKKEVFGELRPAIMEWVFCKSRINSD